MKHQMYRKTISLGGRKGFQGKETPDYGFRIINDSILKIASQLRSVFQSRAIMRYTLFVS